MRNSRPTAASKMSESVVPAALRVAYSKGIRAARTFAASTPLPPAQRQFVRRSPESCGCIRRQLLDAMFGSEQKCLYAARKLARGGNQSAVYVRPNAPLVTGGCYRMLAEVRTVTMTRTNHESNVGSRPPADRPCRGSQQPTLRTNAGTALCKGSTFSRLVDSRGPLPVGQGTPWGSQGDPATSLPLR